MSLMGYSTPPITNLFQDEPDRGCCVQTQYKFITTKNYTAWLHKDKRMYYATVHQAILDYASVMSCIEGP